jgi:D-glycero-alpha-D-manno-heptose 1-phosphate guanylyltransferase
METINTLTALILAGGLGTRLRSVVADRPKVLAKVNGRPFIAFLLDQVAAFGIKHIIFCTGYLGEQIFTEFGESYQGIDLEYSHEATPLGTGGALRLALPKFKSDTLLVMNGDSYCLTDINSFWNCHQTKNATATINLTNVADTQRYGHVKINSDNQVISFMEKCSQVGSGLINTGVYLIKRHAIVTIPENLTISLEKNVLPNLIGKGLYAYSSFAKFIDIGIPEDYARGKDFFSPRVLKN